MAKVGEGDARWIVEERADGANVNAWHWAERDVLPWAQRRLQELLGAATPATLLRAGRNCAGTRQPLSRVPQATWSWSAARGAPRCARDPVSR